MSYILDALKKSDQERKRGDVPNLQTVHIPFTAEQRVPWVLYGLISVLLLALILVVGMITFGKKSDAEFAQYAEKREIKEQVIERSRVVSAKPIKQLEEVINKEELAVEAAYELSKKQSEKKRHENEVSRQFVNPVVDMSDIPFFHELPGYLQESIPHMDFAGHVYSTKPASRSIIINNNALSEGGSVMQGLNVEQITVNGVIFRYKDELFRMDILQDWSFE